MAKKGGIIIRLSKIKKRLIKEGRLCYKKGQEVGLYYEKKCLEDVIKNKEARGEDASFEQKLLKSWANYSEADYSSGWS